MDLTQGELYHIKKLDFPRVPKISGTTIMHKLPGSLGYLTVGHRFVHSPFVPRVYEHIIWWFDENLQWKASTDWFSFHEMGNVVEFCCGITSWVGSRGVELMLTWGAFDSKMYSGKIIWDKLKQCFIKVIN